MLLSQNNEVEPKPASGGSSENVQNKISIAKNPDPEKKDVRRVDQRKGKWTFQWGYNRSSYTQSDINFRGQGYRFTLKDVVAKDKPESFDPGVYLNPGLWEIPQYNFKFSYFLTDRLNISFGHDHMKYVMQRGQESNIYGYIDPLAIQRAHLRPTFDSAPYLYLFPNQYKQYEGYHGGEPIAISPDFLKFEHTDGLNYLYVDFGFNQPIWVSSNGENALSFVSAIGGGPIICRSDVRLFGEGRNNRFHLSGYGVSANAGLRLDLINSFFLEFSGKGGYIDLSDIYTTGRSTDRASQNFGFLEMIFSAGTTIN